MWNNLVLDFVCLKIFFQLLIQFQYQQSVNSEYLFLADLLFCFRNLSISSGLFNLLEYYCLSCSLMIIVLLSYCLQFLLSFLALFIWALSLFFFYMSLTKGLSILFIFSQNQLLVLLIFFIVCIVSILFISCLNFIISFCWFWALPILFS